MGYSKRSLPEKLGIKAGHRVAVLNAPKGYMQALASAPSGVIIETKAGGEFDVIQLFTSKRSELEDEYPTLKACIKPNGALWVSWPKAASKSPTDLNENIVREIGLRAGLVDVKVIAVDEKWSGLKFVYRLQDRA